MRRRSAEPSKGDGAPGRAQTPLQNQEFEGGETGASLRQKSKLFGCDVPPLNEAYQKETAAPAGSRNGGEIGVGKPSTQKPYRALGSWIKPDIGSNWIKLSAAAAIALNLHIGGAQ